MKNKKRESLLIIMIIVILLIIICISIMYIYKKGKNTTNELYSTWIIYKQEIVKDNNITYTADTDAGYINVKDNKNMSVCEYGEEKINCQEVTYVINKDSINVINSTGFISGQYKIIIDKDMMILERQESNQSVIIKNYFKKALG